MDDSPGKENLITLPILSFSNLDTDQETWSVRFPHDGKFGCGWNAGL